jgi:hypothetical protein
MDTLVERVISRIAMSNARRVWLIAGVAVLATVALVAGVLIGLRLGDRKTAPQPPVPSALAEDFAQLQTRLHAVVGIAVSAVGDGQIPMTLGEWQTGPAWSTIKVPLIVAALREEQPPTVTDAMTAAITESDTAAAESIWASLGDPGTAARKVDAVLRDTGDPTTVQSQRVRPEFSAFGQTEWPLIDQGAIHLRRSVRQGKCTGLRTHGTGPIRPEVGYRDNSGQPLQRWLGAVTVRRLSGSADGRAGRPHRNDRRRPGGTARLREVR